MWQGGYCKQEFDSRWIHEPSPRTCMSNARTGSPAPTTAEYSFSMTLLRGVRVRAAQQRGGQLDGGQDFAAA